MFIDSMMSIGRSALTLALSGRPPQVADPMEQLVKVQSSPSMRETQALQPTTLTTKPRIDAAKSAPANTRNPRSI
jgi:hypothetical protein